MLTFNSLKKDFKKETGKDASENLDLFLVYYYGRKSGVPSKLINLKMIEFEAWKNETPHYLTRRSA